MRRLMRAIAILLLGAVAIVAVLLVIASAFPGTWGLIGGFLCGPGEEFLFSATNVYSAPGEHALSVERYCVDELGGARSLGLLAVLPKLLLIGLAGAALPAVLSLVARSSGAAHGSESIVVDTGERVNARVASTAHGSPERRVVVAADYGLTEDEISALAAGRRIATVASVRRREGIGVGEARRIVDEARAALEYGS